MISGFMEYKELRGVWGVVNRWISGIHEWEVLRADNGECELSGNGTWE